MVNYDPKCSGKVDLYFLMWPCGVDKHGLGLHDTTTAQPTRTSPVIPSPIFDFYRPTNDADVFVYLEDVAPDRRRRPS